MITVACAGLLSMLLAPALALPPATQVLPEPPQSAGARQSSPNWQMELPPGPSRSSPASSSCRRLRRSSRHGRAPSILSAVGRRSFAD